MSHAAAHTELFARERPYLVGVAYRMLGSRTEAEDVVQEAFTRLPEPGTLASPRAFLTTVVTRLCLDELKSARHRRETYVGPWLPEPWVDGPSAEEQGLARDEASLGLLLLLERLSAKERVVFVLRELLECEFAEVAEALGTNEPACRKLLSRAREKLGAAQEARSVPRTAQADLTARFFGALAVGDQAALMALLAEHVELVSDHGGKATAARNIVRGAEHVARFFMGVLQKRARMPHHRSEIRQVNGAVALLIFAPDGRCESLITLDFNSEGGGARVARVLAYRNPDKLAGIVPSA
jgi:RNA polymerase sigma-70 factor (ECF subfamily)